MKFVCERHPKGCGYVFYLEDDTGDVSHVHWLPAEAWPPHRLVDGRVVGNWLMRLVWGGTSAVADVWSDAWVREVMPNLPPEGWALTYEEVVGWICASTRRLLTERDEPKDDPIPF